jgi:homoserine/homoserine lactone efflux protein
MNFPDHYLTFIIAALVASALPGLAVIGAFTTSLKYGSKNGVIFSLGLIAASTFYFFLSSIGLIVILEEFRYLFRIIKYVGIAYLFYLGVQSFRSQAAIVEVDSEIGKNEVSWKYFISGFFVHLINPKNILFFILILPQYLNLQKPVYEQFFWLTLGSSIPEFIVLLMYVYFAKWLKDILREEKYMILFNKVSGILFICLSIAMLVLF